MRGVALRGIIPSSEGTGMSAIPPPLPKGSLSPCPSAGRLLLVRPAREVKRTVFPQSETGPVTRPERGEILHVTTHLGPHNQR